MENRQEDKMENRQEDKMENQQEDKMENQQEDKMENLKEGRTKKKIFDLLPSIIFAAIGVVFIIIYSCIGDRLAMTYFELVGGIILCFFFPLIGLIFRHRFPTAFNWVLCCFTFLALFIAKGINGYGLIPYYDKILHTTFGIIGSMFIYVFIMLLKGERISLFGKVFLVVLAAMGLGGLWEVFEYICSICFGADPQLVQISLANGTNPIEDTMLDLIVTLIGSTAFCIVLVVDTLTNKHIIDKFFEVSTDIDTDRQASTDTDTDR